jgi:hypothetical protein
MDYMFKLLFKISVFCALIAACYGMGRLYFQLTGGFSVQNISSDFAYNPEWEVQPLNNLEKNELQQAFNQPYYYLGKGCQAYVFTSEDGKYVIKFFKYQRYRLQPWLAYFPPLPAIVKYRQEKMDKKWRKLDGFVKSWKVAFDHLKQETGLVFVHLNKTQDLQKKITIFDKLGMAHQVDLDQMEFCVQRRANMLCATLLDMQAKKDLQGAVQLITQLLQTIVWEYQHGLADNDHALMQNTGVVQGRPIHIDVGQFVQDERVKDAYVYKQEFFTKTYHFKFWVQKNYPELFPFLEDQLKSVIGPEYIGMQPKFRLHGEER